MTRIVIVNADDLGYDPAITRGILHAAREGIVTSATFMVNTPFSADAAAQARTLPSLGIGLHLNLARGDSLAGARSLLGADGRMDEKSAPSAEPADVEREAEAQFARFLELFGKQPTHVDVHKHLHRHAPVLTGLLAVARRHRLPVRAIDDAMRQAIRASGLRCPDSFVGDTGATAYWNRERLLDALDSAREGITEVMCHPGYSPERVRTGYGVQREAELAALTDPAVRRRAAQGDPRLETFSCLCSPCTPGTSA